MKKTLLLPLVYLFLISCENKSLEQYSDDYHESPKNELEEQENLAESIESGYVYGPVDYNDGLLAEVILVDVKMEMLKDLDSKDVPTEEITAACEEAIEEYDKVMAALNNIEAYGVLGEEFKQSVIDYVKASGRIFQIYNDYADLLATPDSEWTNEDATAWDETYNALYEDYVGANDKIINIQEEYASLNNMRLDNIGSTAQEIYEESVETEEVQ